MQKSFANFQTSNYLETPHFNLIKSSSSFELVKNRYPTHYCWQLKAKYEYLRTLKKNRILGIKESLKSKVKVETLKSSALISNLVILMALIR